MQVKSILREYSAILLTLFKLPFVLSTFEWPLKKGFTVVDDNYNFVNSNSYLII